MTDSGAAKVEPAGSEHRILFVSDERAWPSDSGYRRRTAQIISTLASLGPVTWIAAPRNRADRGTPLLVPAELANRIDPILVPAPTRTVGMTAARWATGKLPWPLAAGDWSRAVEELRSHRHGFRLVWSMGVDALAAVERADIVAPLTIVDADLESLKLGRQLASGSVEGVLRRSIAAVDVRRWQRLERRAAATVDGFSLCSDDERRVLGAGGFVTPNSYPAPAGSGSLTGRRANTLLFVGSLGYRPNVDGLVWFVDQVLPLIRTDRPEVTVRVVGGGLADDHELRRLAGVEVVGAVDDVEDELQRAGAAIVPVQWGAGTRIKIIEAFAHRVPVVSTTIGAEGLAVRSGDELLLADDPGGFAAACISVIDRLELTEGLVERANRTFLERYEASAVSHRLAERIRTMPGWSGAPGRTDERP